EIGPRGGQPLVAETQRRELALAEVLGHDVGIAHEVLRDLAARLGPEIENDAALAAIDVEPQIGRDFAVRRLDLDDIGSEVGQHAATGRTGDDNAEIDHTQPIKGQWLGFTLPLPPAARAGRTVFTLIGRHGAPGPPPPASGRLVVADHAGLARMRLSQPFLVMTADRA